MDNKSKLVAVTVPSVLTAALVAFGGVTYSETHSVNPCNLKIRSDFKALIVEDEVKSTDNYKAIKKFVDANGKGSLFLFKNGVYRYFDVSDKTKPEDDSVLCKNWAAVTEYIKQLGDADQKESDTPKKPSENDGDNNIGEESEDDTPNVVTERTEGTDDATEKELDAEKPPEGDGDNNIGAESEDDTPNVVTERIEGTDDATEKKLDAEKPPEGDGNGAKNDNVEYVSESGSMRVYSREYNVIEHAAEIASGEGNGQVSDSKIEMSDNVRNALAKLGLSETNWNDALDAFWESRTQFVTSQVYSTKESMTFEEFTPSGVSSFLLAHRKESMIKALYEEKNWDKWKDAIVKTMADGRERPNPVSAWCNWIFAVDGDRKELSAKTKIPEFALMIRAVHFRDVFYALSGVDIPKSHVPGSSCEVYKSTKNGVYAASND